MQRPRPPRAARYVSRRDDADPGRHVGVGDAIFPVRRQEGGITTGVALHNLESSPGLVRCDLMREGVLRDSASIPLEANGQTSWLIDQEFPAARYVRLRGGGALHGATRGGDVHRRGRGARCQQPDLYDTAGGAGPGDAGSGIDAGGSGTIGGKGKGKCSAIHSLVTQIGG